jgi:hypothetical protein
VKRLRLAFLLAFMLAASLAIPAWAEEPLINIELNYWLPRLAGESESPVGLMYDAYNDDNHPYLDQWVYLKLDPQPFWGIKASADIKLSGGKLGIDYLQTGASASFGSLDDPFDEDDFNPRTFDDMYFYGIEAWNDFWEWEPGYYDLDWNYLYGSKSVSLMSAGLHYTAPLIVDGTTQIDWRMGLKGLKLTESSSLIIREVDPDSEDAPEYYCQHASDVSQSIMAGGPMLGVSCTRRLTPALNLHAGVDIAALMGSVTDEGEFRYYDYYTYNIDLEEWEYQESWYIDSYTESALTLLPALDVNVGVSYAISKVFTIKAGVFATALPSVPSPREWSEWHEQWMKMPSRLVGAVGFTVGAKASF